MVSCNKQHYMKLFLLSPRMSHSCICHSLKFTFLVLHLSSWLKRVREWTFFERVFWERNSRVRVALNFILVIFVTRFVIQPPPRFTHTLKFHSFPCHCNSHQQPCDFTGLALQEFLFQREFLIILSFPCHSIPSPHFISCESNEDVSFQWIVVLIAKHRERKRGEREKEKESVP